LPEVLQSCKRMAELADGEVIETETRMQNAAGEWRWFNTRNVVFQRDDAGNPIQSLGMAVDITEHKDAERHRLELVLEREKVEALRRIISDISHDLRTPITTLGTSIYLINRVTDKLTRLLVDFQARPTPATAAEISKIVLALRERGGLLEESITRMQNLVESLLELARLDKIPSYSFANDDLSLLASNLFNIYQPHAEERGLTLRLEADYALPLVYIDAYELSRAMHKLVDNALLYTPQGGTITLRTYSDPNNAVVFEVIDTGIGMTETEQARIFDRFYRADTARQISGGGLGVGLSIAEKIVQAHGGRIEVESAPSAGSVFRVLLPHNWVETVRG
jgi:two-component system OmpR family sensor kinase